MKKNIIFIDPFAMRKKSGLEYYHGFVSALREKHNVKIVNDLNIKKISDVTRYFPTVDAIIFGYAVTKHGHSEGFYNRDILGLSELNIPKICFVLCFDDFQIKLDWMKRHKITHIFSEYYKLNEMVGNCNIRAHRSLFATTNKEVIGSNEKEYDFGFMGALHVPAQRGNEFNIRVKAIEMSKGMGLKTVFLENKRLSITEYYKTLGKTKAWLCTTSIPYGTIAPRYYDLAKNRCLILCEEWEETYDGIFEDGVNCVMFKRDLSNFQEKLMYYLENDEIRERIIDRAYIDVMGRHLWSNRVDEVCRISGL